MERRDFLKIALGVAAAAATFAASVQAAPLVPQPMTDDGRFPADPDAHSAVTTGTKSNVQAEAGARQASPLVAGMVAIGAGAGTIGVGASDTGGVAIGVVTIGVGDTGERAYPRSQIRGQQNKNPRERGFPSSERMQRRVSTGGSGRGARRGHRGSGGRAAPRRPGMPNAVRQPRRRDWAGSHRRGRGASPGPHPAGGVRGAEACERTGDQNCCKKILHVFSLDSGSHHAALAGNLVTES